MTSFLPLRCLGLVDLESELELELELELFELGCTCTGDLGTLVRVAGTWVLPFGATGWDLLISTWLCLSFAASAGLDGRPDWT